MTRSGDAADAQTIDFATSIGAGDSAEANDFTGNSGTLTFAPGVTSQTFTVQTTQDGIYEGGETFTATLSNNSAGSTIADATATGTILDDGTGPGPFDPTGPGTPDNDVPTLSVSSPTEGEGGQMEFIISLSNPSLETVSFSVATVDTGSATDTTDYSPALEYFNTGSGLWEPVSGDLSFAPGTTTLQVRSATVQDALVEGPESFDLTATVTGGSTTNSSATGTGTITDDDHTPDAVNSSASTLEDTTLTFSAADFGFSDVDTGNTLQAVRIESLPTDGTLFFNGVEITAANLASFNAGSNEISSTDIGLLTFEPALHDSGYDSYSAAGEGDQLNDYDSITFSVSDGVNWSVTPATLTIDVTPVADAPTLTVDGTQTSGGVDLVDLITVPASEGLVKTVYTNVGISPATIDSSTIETIADGLIGGTATVETQPYRDGGNGVDNIPVDNLEVTTGVIYLEAGTTLSFNGYSDDAFRIELGGTTLIDTTGDAYGDYDTSTVGTAAVGSGTVSTYGDFTAASAGYYTFEMYIYNHIGAGDLSVNVSVNGGASQPFDTAAVNMYTGIDAVDAAQGQHSDLILTSGSDGGYYPVELNKGYEGTPIKLTAVDSALVDTDGSEVLSSIVISSIPDGSVLTDGTNSFTATAGNTSVDVTSWNLDNLSYTGYTDLPNGASEVHTLVVTATSQELANGAVVDTATSTANLNITVIETDDPSVITSVDTVSVSEEGLINGLIDNTGDPVDTTDDAFATGVINFTDSDSSTFSVSLTGLTSVTSEGNPINLTSGGDDVDSWSWDAASQTLTGSTSAGVDVLTITLDPVVSSGSNNSVSYTVNLLAPVDHPVNSTEDIMDLQFGVAISDGSNTVNSSLNVRIEDDRPVSGDLSNSLEVPLAQSNVMLVLDFSGSMSGSNLANMKAAVISMLDSYDNAGYTAIQIVNFSSTATVPGDGGWISVADAKSYINALTDADMGGATNYDAALAAAQTAFAETNGYIAGGKNISYFLSDGVPTSGNEVDTAGDQAAWETFVTNNNIDSFAVGFGGAAVTSLEPIAYNGVDATERPAIDATAAGTTLTDSLLATVSTAIPGNLFGSLASGGFGADGNGHVRTVTIDSVTYTYDNIAGTITNSADSNVINDSSVVITTSLGGLITINMDTGVYSYEADPTFTVDFAETIGFTMQDVDGDVTSGIVTLDVSREVKPTPTLNANAADVFEADMADGTNSAGTGEVVTGNILADDTIPNGLSLSTLSIAGGTTVVNGNLITVTTAEGNTLVVDSTTGDYTYTLINAVDHTQLINTGNTITLASDTFSGSLDGWGGSNVTLNGNRMLIDGNNDTATKTFDFGQNYANQTVTVSFDFEATTNWDGGTDNFVVTVNGTDVINDSHTGGTQAYSFDITLNNLGQADVVLLNSSSSNFEDAYIDNFTISGPEIVAVGTDTIVDSFTYVVTDPGGTPYTSTLDVTIHDDVPQVNNSIAVSVDVPESVDSNVIMTLDISGSMTSAVGGSTRFELAKQAMIDTITAYQAQGNANVNLTLFGTQGANLGWMSAADAISYINLLSMDTGSIQYNGAAITGLTDGWTNYEAAVAVTESGYAGAPAADKTVAYFLSDGAPTKEYDDTTTTPTDVTGQNTQDGVDTGYLDNTYLNSWDSFINGNNIALEVVGIGTNLSTSYLDMVQVIPGKNAQVVADITTLSDVLLSTVATVEGSLFGADGDSGILFGADGGHILELSYNGVTYSYDAANPIQTIALSEGDMDLNFETGSFTYTSNVSNGTDVIENFIISVKDSDGDSSLNQPLSMLIGKNQTLTGTDSGETLDGGAGNDILDGGLGNDILIGGLGDDILIGGAGDDLLIGGAGADTFDWNGGDQGTIAMPASDHIQDFVVADDKLDLSGLLDSLGMTDPGVVESYLSLTENASNEAVLSVKDSAGGNVVQEIVLDNVSIQDLKTDLSIDQGATNNDLLNQLIDQSKLIV
ncbi:VWA domain-containing protein [Amphritea atlantica]|uniref:VWA domain-containing protein n=1 Tax=Amphritea atlantica TaxID=355243 RepID=UPI000B828852|nr:VWA domain-containing protein [Amphritea atlantica]